jgi:hypothetical protein
LCIIWVIFVDKSPALLRFMQYYAARSMCGSIAYLQ